jgi:hypothetical protein
VSKYPKTAIKTTVNIAINTIDKFGPISYIFYAALSVNTYFMIGHFNHPTRNFIPNNISVIAPVV